MSQMCPNPNCGHDNPDNAQACTCGEPLLGLLGHHTLLEGRYRVIRVLGCGGMGAVYLADDLRIVGRQVAVKESLDITPQARSQFQAEVGLMVGLDHPGLPKVSDNFAGHMGRQYIVMDYVEGETLEDVVDRRGSLPESEVTPLTEQLLDVLEHLHRHSIVHRDVKPANIKLTPGGRPVLVDFGIAKLHAPGHGTRTWARGVGSPGFAPLEQYGTGTDARSDLYSLGAVTYYLLTGQAPPEAPDLAAGTSRLTPPRQLRSSISPHVQSVIFKAMAVSPDQRYQSAAEMRHALLGPPSPMPIAPAARPLIWTSVGGFAGLACITLIGIALVWAFTSGPFRPNISVPAPVVVYTPTGTARPSPKGTPTHEHTTDEPTATHTTRPTHTPTTTWTHTPKPPEKINLTVVQVSASGQAKDGIDTCGNAVSYPPVNLTDSQSETAWRVEGDGQGDWVEVDFGREVMLASVRILPGYRKHDPCDRSIDWCPKNRIPQYVRLQASGGEQMEVVLDNECNKQTFDMGPWRTASLRITILSSYPRREEHHTDYTTISEIETLGWEF